MIEMVVVLPFILLILAMLLYFGKAMMRLQRASVMDRYAAWQQVADAPGPRADNAAGNDQLNTTFFGGNASAIEGDSGSTSAYGPMAELRSAAANASYDAGQLVQRVATDLPTSRRVTFTTSHTTATDVERYFDGPIEHGSVRIGNEWKFVNAIRFDGKKNKWVADNASHVYIGPPVAEQFFSDLDGRLRPLVGGNRLARAIRGYYYSPPSYRGPDNFPKSWLTPQVN